MKTYIILKNDEVSGIGMCYLEDGSLIPDIAIAAESVGVDEAIRLAGEHAKAAQLLDDSHTVEVVEVAAFPGANGMAFDKTFRGAWEKPPGLDIAINMGKAKEITHGRRRRAREKEFEPFDKVISLQLPGWQAAEQGRAGIRQKYAGIQNDIDAAITPDELKQIISANNL